MQIQIGRVSEGVFDPRDIVAMHELRFEVFRERLKWEVSVRDRQEIDGYDAQDPVYMIVKNDAGLVCGCWRVLPTTSPYMMKDTFPQTLGSETAPVDDRVWELSRFALRQGEGVPAPFCEMTIAMMERMAEYALERDVVAFVTVTTTAIERMLRGMGIGMQRFAPPVQIGIEKTVAFRIDVSAELLALLRHRRMILRANSAASALGERAGAPAAARAGAATTG